MGNWNGPPGGGYGPPPGGGGGSPPGGYGPPPGGGGGGYGPPPGGGGYGPPPGGYGAPPPAGGFGAPPGGWGGPLPYGMQPVNPAIAPMGSIPLGFLAGFFGGCVGLALVYILAKGPNTKKGASIGFATGIGLGILARALSH